MITMFAEISALCISLTLAIFFQIRPQRKKGGNVVAFSRLLLSTVAILVVDILGWIFDGHPIAGQVWPITLIDGLDLIITTLVCWCWGKYTLSIEKEGAQKPQKWYHDSTTFLLILQVLLVCTSQIFGFYYSVDSMGVYHRERGYFIHFAFSMVLLCKSSVRCFISSVSEKDKHRKHELLFAACVTLIPVFGNIFQLYVYGYPTVWLCMTFAIFAVYVHIQNQRASDERERQNQMLEAALKEAQKANNAKTDFLARMSHDMRTPMNGILGIAALLRDRTDPQEIRADVEQIEKSGKFLLNLINDTLDMSRIESGKLELHPAPATSDELFKNVIVTAQILASQKDVKLGLEVPQTHQNVQLPIITDASRVEQVLMNLITNAVKFTPPGGTVTLHMDYLDITDEKLTARYVISDNGIGMSEEFLQHIFEPFSQEGRANTNHESGTGLGLTIVKQIVDMMGGSIEIKSRLNVGTKVTVLLTYPRYFGKFEPKEQETIDFSLLNGKRVLLCEDHPINAQIAIRLLQKHGVTTEVAENGQIGLEKFISSEAGYFDAILMDIRMPVMNGLETTKAIRSLSDRAEAQSIPIIAMTANAFDEDIRQCTQAGMNAHLAKPVDPQKLYETLCKFIT